MTLFCDVSHSNVGDDFLVFFTCNDPVAEPKSQQSGHVNKCTAYSPSPTATQRNTHRVPGMVHDMT